MASSFTLFEARREKSFVSNALDTPSAPDGRFSFTLFKTKTGKSLVFNELDTPSAPNCQFSLNIEGTDEKIGMWITKEDFLSQIRKITGVFRQANPNVEELSLALRKLISMLIENGGYSSLQIAKEVAAEIFAASPHDMVKNIEILQSVQKDWRKRTSPGYFAKMLKEQGFQKDEIAQLEKMHKKEYGETRSETDAIIFKTVNTFITELIEALNQALAKLLFDFEPTGSNKVLSNR